MRRGRHSQKRVSPPERVGHAFPALRIGHPLAVHHQAVLVGAGRQDRLLQPATAVQGMHGLGFGVPVVERSRDTNGGRRGMGEFEANRLQWGPGAPGIVMMFAVFHRCEFTFKDWLCHRLAFCWVVWMGCSAQLRFHERRLIVSAHGTPTRLSRPVVSRIEWSATTKIPRVDVRRHVQSWMGFRTSAFEIRFRCEQGMHHSIQSSAA